MNDKFESKNEKMTLAVPYIVKRDKGGYTFECIDLNIITQSNSLQEGRKNTSKSNSRCQST